jgi:hypothetical protein
LVNNISFIFFFQYIILFFYFLDKRYILMLFGHISCSPNLPHLISQLGVIDGVLSIYQVRTCSKIVTIHHVDVPVPEHRIVSSSWTPEGNLFVSDEFGNVWLVAIDANKLYSIVKSESHKLPKNKSIVVSYKNGVIVVNSEIRVRICLMIKFYLNINFCNKRRVKL